MDYLYERRRRRRYRSPLSFTRDEHDIEQEIIERAMSIERNQERNLRHQFEYIVYNVKELERRRQLRHRTQSPDYYEIVNSPYRPRNLTRHPYRNSSSERFSLTNESNYSETKNRSSLKLKNLVQITMVYLGNGNERHGDEIMVLQENIIVFKGFLRTEETFTFKFKQYHRQSIVKLEFFLNELFECYLSIDCQQKQIEQENEYFQLKNIQIQESNKNKSNDEQQTSETDRSRRNRQTHNGDKRSTVYNNRHHQKSKSSSNQTSKDRKETSNTKQRSHHSPSPPPSPPTKQNEKSKSNTSKTHSSVSRQSSLKTKSTTDKKPSKRPSISSENDNDDKKLKENIPTKPSYGPPQLSAFAHSSSENESDEVSAVGKQQDEKPSSEIIKKSESPVIRKDDIEEEEEDPNDSGSFVGFLQLLQAMSSGGIHGSPSSGDGDGIQGLLARLGIVTQTSSRKKLINVAPRQIGNVENFLLVYLDSRTPNDLILNKIRGLVNYLKLFDDADDCVAFINSISNEKVLLIVNDTLGDSVVSRVKDLQQLFAVYVLCETKEQTENWSTNQPKIHEINTDINEILDKIKIDIEKDEENSLTFCYLLPDANPKDDPGFLINQITKEALLDTDEMIDAKKELIDFCQSEYENNNEQLTSIQQFDNDYQKEDTLKYFQKHLFLYKMLNKGFRIPEIDILFKLRLFIQNLHNLILSSSNTSSVRTIYRSQVVTNDELDSLKKCTDGTLLTFSNFFLASATRPEQKSKSSSTEDNNEQEIKGEEILFEIDVSNSNSYMSIDDQILVTFGLVTRVGDTEKDKNGQTIIHLRTINNERDFDHIIEPIRKEIRAPHPSLRIVKLFVELEQYSQAVNLGQTLLGNLPNVRKDPLLALARIYHSLGTTLYEREEYDQALDVIKKSHELYIKFLPEDAPQLSPTWNNMGSIYLRQGKTDLALEYHEKALSIQLKSPSPDLPSIISYSNNIGGVYLKLERYDEALVHFQRALQVEEQTLPSNHPELAGTYHRIGGVYFRQNNYEKALEYYDKTLQIELESLPDNHPTVAVTYHNRGTAFEGLGQIDKAVESAEKAVERLLKTLPKEHPQVRMNQAYVDKLKQKLWVKQLFTS